MKSFFHSPFSASFIVKKDSSLFSALSSRAELPVDMGAKVSCSIETLSREISAPMRLVPLGEGDFSTLWRLCIESPSQPKLASRETLI